MDIIKSRYYDPTETPKQSLDRLRQDIRHEQEGSVRKVRIGLRLERREQDKDLSGCSSVEQFAAEFLGLGIGQTRKYMRIKGLRLELLDGTDLSINELDWIASRV